MAHIVLTMTAIGIAEEVCTDCECPFVRGERMNAVKSESGEPLGWYCDDCIAAWRATGAQAEEPTDDAAD